ncbi:hypothetical protein [Microcystis phage Mae-JY24]
MNVVTDKCPVIGLDQEFPDHLFVVCLEDVGQYGCCAVAVGRKYVHCLMVFEREPAAVAFGQYLTDSCEGLGDASIKKVTFNQAREIAKGRPLPICGMALGDSEAVIIHYVR